MAIVGMPLVGICLLVVVDVGLRCGKFGKIRAIVRATRVRTGSPVLSVGELLDAVSRSARWFKGCSPCLTRSVVTAVLLRSVSKVNAEVVLGVTHTPLSGHAWIEVGSVLSPDHEDNIRRYAVVDRLSC
jgi:hypothetical protein